jgi:hypothetical protein
MILIVARCRSPIDRYRLDDAGILGISALQVLYERTGCMVVGVSLSLTPFVSDWFGVAYRGVEAANEIFQHLFCFYGFTLWVLCFFELFR